MIRTTTGSGSPPFRAQATSILIHASHQRTCSLISQQQKCPFPSDQPLSQQCLNHFHVRRNIQKVRTWHQLGLGCDTARHGKIISNGQTVRIVVDANRPVLVIVATSLFRRRVIVLAVNTAGTQERFECRPLCRRQQVGQDGGTNIVVQSGSSISRNSRRIGVIVVVLVGGTRRVLHQSQQCTNGQWLDSAILPFGQELLVHIENLLQQQQRR